MTSLVTTMRCDELIGAEMTVLDVEDEATTSPIDGLDLPEFLQVLETEDNEDDDTEEEEEEAEIDGTEEELLVTIPTVVPEIDSRVDEIRETRCLPK